MFKSPKAVIGMIHVQALPGTPNYGGSTQAVIENALQEAQKYERHGVDGIMIENMHDVPYLNSKVGPEVSSLMAIIGYQLKEKIDLPCGIQLLSSANIESMATANSAGLDFIRAEGFVFGHVADEGYINASAGELLRFRKMIEARNIAIWTDVKKKHSAHAITSDVSIGETVEAASFFLSDGIVVTGTATGKSVNDKDVKEVRNHTQLPVFIGSGIEINNIENYFDLADGFIVGSHFKKDGNWKNDVDEERVRLFMDKVHTLRSQTNN